MQVQQTSSEVNVAKALFELYVCLFGVYGPLKTMVIHSQTTVGDGNTVAASICV